MKKLTRFERAAVGILRFIAGEDNNGFIPELYFHEFLKLIDNMQTQLIHECCVISQKMEADKKAAAEEKWRHVMVADTNGIEWDVPYKPGKSGSRTSQGSSRKPRERHMNPIERIQNALAQTITALRDKRLDVLEEEFAKGISEGESSVEAECHALATEWINEFISLNCQKPGFDNVLQIIHFPKRRDYFWIRKIACRNSERAVSTIQ